MKAYWNSDMSDDFVSDGLWWLWAALVARLSNVFLHDDLHH
jgi:hypothetical protein